MSPGKINRWQYEVYMVIHSREKTLSAQKSSPESLPVKKCDALVLDARLRQSLVTVRSLGRRGLRVAALDTPGSVPAFSSRWCQQHFVCQGGEATDEYLDTLEQAIEHTGVTVLIASSDSTIALLRMHREQLKQHIHLALAEEPALGIAVNKEQTLAIAGQLGLGIPRGVLVKSESDVAPALQEIGLPVVIKPVESWLWGSGRRVASLLATTKEEALRATEHLTGSGGPVLFQQFLSGRREAIHLFYAGGEVYARFAQWAKRTDPPLGGTSVLRQGIAIPPDIGMQAEQLVRAIDLEGYAEVEFRRDDKGVPYLMEINPRLSASVEIAVRSGVDFPLLLYQWASGQRIDKVEGYRPGRWMRYLRGDLMSTIASLQQHGRPGIPHPARALLDFCISCIVPMSYDYIDWKDPIPAFVATTAFSSQWIGSAITKRLSRLRRKFS
jgi:predicted ATP-grasp superfamily ATP-dependent carboligase